MSTSEFKREEKTSIPVVAICYDFDKTLSPDDMQAQGYIQSVGFDVGDFWKKSNGLARGNDMDNNLAYMYVMMTESEGKFVFNRQKLQEYGAQVQLFPGVETWFERIRKYGKTKGVEVEHYIISSGLKEMIEGTSVAKNGAFKKIYASSFYYNERGVAVWPAQVINYTNKTQFLFRIEKGVLDINDPGVNEYFTPDNMRIPFRNMIYIGDSDTDIPCMKLVNSYGGHSIGVYNADIRSGYCHFHIGFHHAAQRGRAFFFVFPLAVGFPVSVCFHNRQAVFAAQFVGNSSNTLVVSSKIITKHSTIHKRNRVYNNMVMQVAFV